MPELNKSNHDTEAVERLYDARASEYSLRLPPNYKGTLTWKLLSANVVTDAVCLDVGVANGLYAVPLAGQVGRIVGIDLSRKMLGYCRAYAEQAGRENVNVSQASATELGLATDHFDFVYSFATLTLVPQPERAFAEIYRVLKSGGRAVLDVSGSHNLSRIHWARQYRRRGSFGVSHFTFERISKIFKELGFRILETHATGLLDQWKYIPLLRYVKALDRIVHNSKDEPDRDYRASQRLPKLANRWYFVLEKSK